MASKGRPFNGEAHQTLYLLAVCDDVVQPYPQVFYEMFYLNTMQPPTMHPAVHLR